MKATWFVLSLSLVAASAQAQPSKLTYIYTDPHGTPLAEADTNGNVIATFDYSPYGNQTLGDPAAGPGYNGHVDDPESGLVYMQARYYDPFIGRFQTTDPVLTDAGNLFHFNRYAYANDNPGTNLDPDGRDCTTANRVTTCFTALYRVSFPSQPGFQDFTSSSTNYHFYSVPVATPNMTKTQDQNYLINNPTPGFPKAASAQGVSNDATPFIGNIIPISISPVISFQLINQMDGNPVVVNVTEPGHPLQSGVVIREATQMSDGSTSIQTWGEGTSSLQSSGSPFGNDINSVWQDQGPPSPPSPTGCSNAAGSMNNVCSK